MSNYWADWDDWDAELQKRQAFVVTPFPFVTRSQEEGMEEGREGSMFLIIKHLSNSALWELISVY